MRKFFTLLLTVLLLCTAGAHAQDRYYTFKDSSSSAYTELTSATVLTNTFDRESYTMDLGFDLNLFGIAFTDQEIEITRFGAVLGKNMMEEKMFGVDAFVIWQYLPIDNTSSLSYAIEGDAGSRIVKIQFKNVTPKNGNAATDVINFQVWLHEDGSSIETHIGPVNISSPDGIYLDANATGPQSGIFLSNLTFAQKFEAQFLWDDPDMPKLDFNNTFAHLNAPPMYGKVYKFRHIEVPPPPKTLMLGSPVGGEVWKVGEKHEITWGSESIDKVKIEYSTTNGSSWTPIATVDAAPETYLWTIPNTISAACIVRISDNDDPSITGESLYPFEIQKASGGSGITEMPNELNISIYPNPVSDKLTITLPDDASASGINVRVLSIEGKEILTENNTSPGRGYYELQLPHLNAGTYLLEVNSGDRISRQYFIKK